MSICLSVQDSNRIIQKALDGCAQNWLVLGQQIHGQLWANKPPKGDVAVGRAWHKQGNSIQTHQHNIIKTGMKVDCWLRRH